MKNVKRWIVREVRVVFLTTCFIIGMVYGTVEGMLKDLRKKR